MPVGRAAADRRAGSWIDTGVAALMVIEEVTWGVALSAAVRRRGQRDRQ
jgi:hypothetical protein